MRGPCAWPATRASEPCILLVGACPHGCGTRLGLQLRADDPMTDDSYGPDEAKVLGGYRCTTCDGEGRLALQPIVAQRRDPAQA